MDDDNSAKLHMRKMAYPGIFCQSIRLTEKHEVGICYRHVLELTLQGLVLRDERQYFPNQVYLHPRHELRNRRNQSEDCTA
jgi:hypothetical protein